MAAAWWKAMVTPLRLLRVTLLVVVPVIAALGGLYLYARGGQQVETENAYVKQHNLAVSAEVSGRVIEVPIHDDQPVEVGTLLFRLDPTPFEIAVARARAQMDVVRTDVQSLRVEYRATLLDASSAEERIAFLAKQLERQELLKEKGMSRADVYDEAKHNLEEARSRLKNIHESTNRVLAGLLGDPQLPAERHPRFVEAKAAYDAATVDLAHTVVKAPAAGVVTNMKLQVGEHVEKGSAIFSIIQSGPVWVEANFKETQLTYMRPGQRAIVVADAYPDIEWQAKVLAISAATGAEFAVLPPQNATGNWVKVVQRLPVQLQVEQPPGQQQLRAGMTVTVAVDTGRERGLPRPVRRLVDKGWLPSFLEPRTALARGEK
ncbi:MAG TPA: HlyD family secretion protein [Burkholderiales bacterium]|nr:HlyD family secretion protein [Burkholderiales bacterium]